MAANRPMPSPQEMATAYQNGMRTKGVENYKKGIARLTVSPTQLAKAQQAKMLSNVTDAVTSGRWAAGLDRVSLQQFQTLATTKGAANLSTGAAAAAPKYQAYQQAKGGDIQALRDRIASAKAGGANPVDLAGMWINGIRAINGKPPV